MIDRPTTSTRLLRSPRVTDEIGWAAGVAWRCISDAASPRRTAAALARCRGRVLVIAEGAAMAPTARAADAWAEAVSSRATRVLLYGAGADAIAERLAAHRGPATVVRCCDVLDATQAAAHLAARNGTVVLAVAAGDGRVGDDAIAQFRAAVGALALADEPVEVA